MSYLMTLYVYYHGNNLYKYGIVKGSKAIKEENKGLTYDDIQYSGIIPQQDLEVIKQQEKFRKENNYEEMMRQAILKAQKESLILSKKGLAQNDIIENTPDGLLDEIYEDNGQIDMSFFNELNGF